MRLRYRDGTEDDDELFNMLPESQRMYVARCIGLGPNWVKDSQWERTIDLLLSIRRHDGKSSFYREVGRMMSPDFH